MKCPFCNADDTSVIDSRVSEEGNRIRRRRRCPVCDKRFTTYETVELRLPQVVKQDGNRSEFNRDKMLTSFMRALHKRPVPTEYVDAAVDRIIQKLLSLGKREVPSRTIGEMVMQELYRLDKVAYIRFASVYRSFQDADDFRDAIKEVQKVQKVQKVPKIPRPPREAVGKKT
jgi:transcriptional repressor NrdR